MFSLAASYRYRALADPEQHHARTGALVAFARRVADDRDAFEEW
ncbi:hypothetical protein [Caballeronia sp. 15715]